MHPPAGGAGLGGAGALTDAGRDLKQRIEDTTDALALPAFDALDDAHSSVTAPDVE